METKETQTQKHTHNKIWNKTK